MVLEELVDWFAVVSMGVYPTPTPTNSQRAALAVSFGLLSSLSEGIVILVRTGLSYLRMGLSW